MAEPPPSPPATWASWSRKESVWPRVWQGAHPLQPKSLATLGGLAERPGCLPRSQPFRADRP